MTNDANNTLVYDAENRVLSATNGGASGTYTYDGKSLRVKKASGSTTTVYIFSGSKVIAEYDNGASVGSPSREYIYSGSSILAKIDSSGTRYYHQDQLSNRVVTDSNGNILEQLGHYPFGESWYNASNDKLLFTSYERDSESGNDYAMARYGVNRLARFSSPDPLAGSTSSPQSLNHYSYGLNDPVNLADPTGMFIIDAPPEPDPFQMPGDPFGGGGSGFGCEYNEDDFLNTTTVECLYLGPLTYGHGGGGGGGGGGSDPKQKFQDCLDKYGDDRAQQNLTYDGYLAAQQAASTAQVATSEVLALWDNENSLSPNMKVGQRGPAGEVGAMQIRPGAVKDLSRFGQLSAGWNTNLLANLTAGATYYADMSDKYNIPGTQAAAAYNGGIRGYTGSQAQGYQTAFNQRQAMMMNLVNCMR
jgi:RHS repeat-associated protein